MEYTVQRLAKLAGVSARTLRYYDEIGLLIPVRVSSNGYRVYGQKEVDLLQQILFYREMGVELAQIAEILYSPGFSVEKALDGHLSALLERRERLDMLIESVRKTIKHVKGEIKMNNNEKFEAFKKNLIDINERNYGSEIREKYGDDTIDKSNKKLLNMSRDDMARVQKMAEKINIKLAEALKTGDPASEQAQEVCELHKEWLTHYWSEYSGEAHRGLAQMYVDDERFTAYYDKSAPGCARFLKEAIDIFTAGK